MANYITVADVRAAGISVAEASDAAIEIQITTWQQVLERATRQWFDSRAISFRVDGNGSDTLNFGIPIIDITEIMVNGSTVALDTEQYLVYNGNPYPDDRQNPRITLMRNGYGNGDIFTESPRNERFTFHKGRQNQYISGNFGYVEADGTTPGAIKRALTKLVVEKIRSAPGAVFVEVDPLVGQIMEEWTDGHKIKYRRLGGDLKVRRPGLIGITEDQEILDIIKLYKGPIGIAVPSSGWFGEGGN